MQIYRVHSENEATSPTSSVHLKNLCLQNQLAIGRKIKLIRCLFAVACLLSILGFGQQTLRGQDIGAQITSQFNMAPCNKACTIQVPAGMNPQSTPIIFPCVTNGKVELIGTGPSSVLNYTGSSDSIEALCPGTAAENFIVKDLQIQLSPAARSGIHISAFNGGLIENVLVSGGTNADGILNEGANGITILNSNFSNNANGIHNVSIQNFAPNAVHVIGGQIFSNSNCGVYEQGSSYGRGVGNVYQAITFQFNGTNNAPSTGHMCLQNYANLTVRDNYFEYRCGTQTVPYSIWVGDSTYQGSTALFESNAFSSCGSTSTINLANSFAATFIGNGEGGAISCFVTQGSPTWSTAVMVNYALAVTNFACGNTSTITYK